jgi:hypothetical protein
MNEISYPTPPRIRLRVGVSGHRLPPKLPAESEPPLRARIERILAAIVTTARKAERQYAQCAPGSRTALSAAAASEFSIVSSLAEGSDRIVAEVGLAAGFGLEALLPFGRAEYAQDFETAESRAAFTLLLDRAAAIFELDGAADDRPRAYETAGLAMLANIDLLIAIWDGEEAAGVGGTAQIVARAIADGIPVVWIEPTQPQLMRLSSSSARDVPPANFDMRPGISFLAADEATIVLAIERMIAVPAQAEVQASLKRYLAEREPHWNLCPWYPLLLWVFAGRAIRWADFRLRPAISDSNMRWQDYLTMLPKDRAQRRAVEKILLPAFSTADRLAVYYSFLYRGAYIFNFLFAAAAVGLALGGILTHDIVHKGYLVFAELVTITAVLATWRHGYNREWHRRWLDYRRLAECLRHMRILAPIGSERPVVRPGRDLDVDEMDWVNWYAWSLRRLLPVPDCVVDASYLAAIRDAVRAAEIAGQIAYHKENARTTARLERNIGIAGKAFLGLTAFICFVFLGFVATGYFAQDDRSGSGMFALLVTFFTALLTTFGSALNAIHAQGDFKTVAEQSAQTADRLTAIDEILAAEPLSFARLSDRIETTSDIMMYDLLEWQTVFRTRPLSLPA